MQTIKALEKLSNLADVYAAGGYARDILIGKDAKDVDIVVRKMRTTDIIRFLREYGSIKKVNLAGENNMSILLFKGQGDEIEAQISLPRRGKRRKPDFRNSLRQDAAIRDFRINAIYIKMKKPYTTVDPFNGIEDIIARKIVPVGSPKRCILDSPIRMLRAIALAARTGYTIDDHTLQAIKYFAHLISTCSADVIRKQINYVLMSDQPSKYFMMLEDLSLLQYIIPELHACVGVKQNKYHSDEVFAHLTKTVDYCDKDIVLRLAGLLHDIGKPLTKKVIRGKVTFHKHEVVGAEMVPIILGRLGYDNKTIEEVRHLVGMHMYYYSNEWSDATVRRFIRKSKIPKNLCEEKKINNFPLFKLRAAERKSNPKKGGKGVTEDQKALQKRIIAVYAKSTALSVNDLNIDGHDLMAYLGIGQSKTIGEILNHLLSVVMDRPALNEKEKLLEESKKILNKLTSV